MQTIQRTYETFEDARNVVARLEADGIHPDQISLVGRHRTGDDGTAEGAAIGGAIGGAGGLLASLVSVTVPGIGPLLAAGWLGSTLIGAGTGALAGGAIGAVADAGTAGRNADDEAEILRSGGAVVGVRAPDEQAPRVRMIMDQGLPLDETGRSPGVAGASEGTPERTGPIAGAVS